MPHTIAATAADRTARASAARPLIVDIGCHRGDDTAYYLAKGFDVLAVEANPALVAGCRARFGAEIASGRLELAHACVSDRRERARFFVNRNDGWSSAVERYGMRGSGGEHLSVLTVPIDALLAGRPIPHFLKMDVEGLEARLLSAMRRLPAAPTVLALEIDFYEGDPVGDLEALGYDRFRIVRQPSYEPDPSMPEWTFTRCSSGRMERRLLDGAVDAAAARRQFTQLCTESYRWHDLYAFAVGDPALAAWGERQGG